VNRFRDAVARPAVFREYVECTPIVGAGFGVEPGDFLRDYARNEPVTLESLERMGWDVEGGVDGASSYASVGIPGGASWDGDWELGGGVRWKSRAWRAGLLRRDV
jgi:hypothetical protein